jgi:hypothetical protein
MTLLTYKEKYVLHNASNSVSTANSDYVNDTYAVKSDLVLTQTQVVFVVYQSTSPYNASNYYTGRKNIIYINGTIYSKMNTSTPNNNYPSRNTCFWVGLLGAGTHDIRGLFASVTNGQTTTISERTLIIYVLDGDETSFKYIDNTTAQSRSTSNYGVDTYATTTFTPSSACKALILYGATTLHSATNDSEGYVLRVGVGAPTSINPLLFPSTTAFQSDGGGANCAMSITTVYATSLSSSEVSVKGYYERANLGTVTLSRTVLAVLLFNNDVQIDVSTSATSTNNGGSDSLSDDPYASISRTFEGELLVFGLASKERSEVHYNVGSCYGLNIDGSDVVLSRSSCNTSYSGESNFVAYATSVTSSPAPHIIKGRYASNYPTVEAQVDSRNVVALWIPPITYDQITGSEVGTGIITDANATVTNYLVGSETGTGSINTAYIYSNYYISGSETGTGSLTTANMFSNYYNTGAGSGTGSITTATPNIRYSIIGTGNGSGSCTTSVNGNVSITGSSIGNGNNVIGSINLLDTAVGNESGTGSLTTATIDLSTKVDATSSLSGTGTIIIATMINGISCVGNPSSTGNYTASVNLFTYMNFNLGGSGDTSSTCGLFEWLPCTCTITGTGSITVTADIYDAIDAVATLSGSGSYSSTGSVFYTINGSVSGNGSSTSVATKNISVNSTSTGLGSTTSIATLKNSMLDTSSGTGNSTSVVFLTRYMTGSETGIGTYTDYFYSGNTLIGTGNGSGSSTSFPQYFLNIQSSGRGIGTQLNYVGVTIKIFEDPTTFTGTGSSTATTNIRLFNEGSGNGSGTSEATNNILLSIIGLESGRGISSSSYNETDYLTSNIVGVGKSFGIVGVHKSNNEKVSMFPTEFLHPLFFPIEVFWTSPITRLNIDASDMSITGVFPEFKIIFKT